MSVSQSTNPPADGAVNPSDALGGRHPAALAILRFFEVDHLPSPLKAAALPVRELALQMVRLCPDGPELAAGLRKLLEAKDCFVRARL